MKTCVNIFLLLLVSIATSAQTKSTENENRSQKILIVLSNAGHYGTSDIKTANHFAETVVPYHEFISAGYEVDLVSPKGGRVPIGYINTSDPLIAQYIHDHDFMDKIKDTHEPSEIEASAYQAIFYSGGGAAMFGVPEDVAIQKIAMEIYEQNQGVVSAICHGTAGIVNLKTSDGSYLVKNKKVNGFPDLFENKEAEYYKQFPFSIQESIKEKGGDFVFSEEGWDGHYVVDGRLVTGQDPASGKVLAHKIIDILKP